MRRILSFLFAVGCLGAAVAAGGQTYKPRAIHFTGVSGYTEQEMMAAAGLQPGEALSDADMNARCQRLLDTGLFDGIKYKFDGKDLTFELTPAARLFAVRLVNLPLTPGPELDAKLRARVPLYRGEVPSDGGILDDIRAALEEQLKAVGIVATVTTVPFTDPVQHRVTGVGFTVTSPPILIGAIQPDGGALDPDALRVLARVTGAAYDCEGSRAAIVRDVTEVYRDKGYLDVTVQSAQLGSFSVESDAVRIPFRVAATPGPLFHVSSIQLAPDMLVTQADFDKQPHTKPGDVADAEHISQNWRFIERQYHNQGYMRAKIMPVATLDHAQGTVSYAVTGVSGAVFTMGKITFENVADNLHEALMAAWKIPEGAVFNEGAILGFFATHAVNPQLEKEFQTVSVKYVLQINDSSRTVDVKIRLERR